MILEGIEGIEGIEAPKLILEGIEVIGAPKVAVAVFRGKYFFFDRIRGNKK